MNSEALKEKNFSVCSFFFFFKLPWLLLPRREGLYSVIVVEAREFQRFINSWNLTPTGAIISSSLTCITQAVISYSCTYTTSNNLCLAKAHLPERKPALIRRHHKMKYLSFPLAVCFNCSSPLM